MILLPDPWRHRLAGDGVAATLGELAQFIESERAQGPVYPEDENVFHALELCPPEQVRVVILGQDPYPGPGQAHGLSFSVRPGVPVPRSLRNIFRELSDDLGCPVPVNGCLEGWARRGVLLLNTVLTVRAGEANSHADRGWEVVTDAVIRELVRSVRRIVFVLWGAQAQRKSPLIPVPPHVIIVSSHPSPLSARRGFFGSRPFSRANTALVESGQQPIDWRLA